MCSNWLIHGIAALGLSSCSCGITCKDTAYGSYYSIMSFYCQNKILKGFLYKINPIEGLKTGTCPFSHNNNILYTCSFYKIFYFIQIVHKMIIINTICIIYSSRAHSLPLSQFIDLQNGAIAFHKVCWRQAYIYIV